MSVTFTSMRDRHYVILVIAFAWLLTPVAQSRAGDTGFIKFGAMSAAETVDSQERYEQFELFITYGLPLSKEWEHWSFFTDIDTTAGMISDRDQQSAIGSIGPRLGFKRHPLVFDIGTRFTLVSDSELGGKILDGPVHFSSHFRIGLRISDIEIGCRIQHMSNAGFYDNNPGLDLLVVDVGYYF